MAVAIIAYIVTVVHAATTRTLGGQTETLRPEERLVSWPKWLFGLLGVLLVIWLLYKVRGILLPFVLGGVIAYLLNPVITHLEGHGWKRERAVWLVFGVFLLVLVGALVLIVPQLVDEAKVLAEQYNAYAYRTRVLLSNAQETVVAWGRLVGMLPDDVRRAFGNLGERAQSYAGLLLQNSLGMLNRSLVLVSLLVITPVVTFWVLRDYRRIGWRLLRAFPEPRRTGITEVLSEINKLVGSYLLGMAIMMVIVGIYAIVVLSIARVSFFVLLGIMTGVLYVIPYLGYPTAMIVIGLTMAASDQSLGLILIVLGFLIGGNIVFDYVVTPRVVGGRVGLHPLVVIFSLLAGAALLKFVGLIVAVPLAGAVKVVLLHYWPEMFEAPPPSAESASV